MDLQSLQAVLDEAALDTDARQPPSSMADPSSSVASENTDLPSPLNADFLFSISQHIQTRCTAIGVPSCVYSIPGILSVGTSYGFTLVFSATSETCIATLGQLSSDRASIRGAVTATCMHVRNNLNRSNSSSSSSLLSSHSDLRWLFERDVSVVSAFESGPLVIYDLHTGSAVRTVKVPNADIVRELAFIGDESVVAIDSQAAWKVSLTTKLFAESLSLSGSETPIITFPQSTHFVQITGSALSEYCFVACVTREDLTIFLVRPVVRLLFRIYPVAATSFAEMPFVAVRDIPAKRTAVAAYVVDNVLHVVRITSSTSGMDTSTLEPFPLSKRMSSDLTSIQWHSDSCLLLSCRRTAFAWDIGTRSLLEVCLPCFDAERCLFASFAGMPLMVVEAQQVYRIRDTSLFDMFDRFMLSGKYVAAFDLMLKGSVTYAQSSATFVDKAQTALQVILDVNILTLQQVVDKCFSAQTSALVYGYLFDRFGSSDRESYASCLQCHLRELNQVPKHVLLVLADQLSESDILVVLRSVGKLARDASDELVSIFQFRSLVQALFFVQLEVRDNIVEAMDAFLQTVFVRPQIVSDSSRGSFFDHVQNYLEGHEDARLRKLFVAALFDVNGDPSIGRMPWPRLRTLFGMDAPHAMNLVLSLFHDDSDWSPFRKFKKLRFDGDAVDEHVVHLAQAEYACPSRGDVFRAVIGLWISDIDQEMQDAQPGSGLSDHVKRGLADMVISSHARLLGLSPTIVHFVFICLAEAFTIPTVDRVHFLLQMVRNFGNELLHYDRALHTCTRLRLDAVSVELYRLQDRVVDALQVYLSSSDSDLRTGVFSFVSSVMSSPDSSSQHFARVVLSSLPALVRLDSEATVRLVIDTFSSDISTVLKELVAFPELQFRCLRGYFSSSSSNGFAHFGAQAAMDTQSDNSSSLQRAQSVVQSVAEAHELVEMYVRLLCRYDPDGVYNFLLKTDRYRLDYCLRVCQEYEVTDAIAYLMERTGDFSGALKMVMDVVERVLFEPFQNIKSPASLVDHSALDLSRFHRYLAVALAMCERSVGALADDEVEGLWFSLLSILTSAPRRLSTLFAGFGGPEKLRSLQAEKLNLDFEEKALVSEKERLEEELGQSSDPSVREQWKQVAVDLKRVRADLKAANSRIESYIVLDAAALAQLQSLETEFEGIVSRSLETVLMSMVHRLHEASVLAKIINEHGAETFGVFRRMISFMLENYKYEHMLMGTVSNLVQSDTFRLSSHYVSSVRMSYKNASFSTSEEASSEGTAPSRASSRIPVGVQAGSVAALNRWQRLVKSYPSRPVIASVMKSIENRTVVETTAQGDLAGFIMDGPKIDLKSAKADLQTSPHVVDISDAIYHFDAIM